MLGHNFYHGTLRKYVVMFGNMFNDIDIVRYKEDGTANKAIRVPIAYGPAEKFLSRLRTDANLDREIAIQLPRLAFEITGIEYDPNRTLNRMQRNVAKGNSDNSLLSQSTPTPYNIQFSLYGMFANNEDAIQVVEQIVPFFRPEFTHTVTLVPEIGDKYDIPTVMNDVSFEDTYDSNFEERRAIIYTFNFTVKGYLFGPVTNKGVIRRTRVDLTIPNEPTAVVTDTGPQSKLTLTPGLMANGSPTSNSAASIPISDIGADANYGFAFDKEDFFDGLSRHSEE
jgi:hypothetical protein